MMEKQYLLPEHLLVALMRYLETRPYKEVAAGIAGLSQLEEVKPTAGDETSQSPSR